MQSEFLRNSSRKCNREILTRNLFNKEEGFKITNLCPEDEVVWKSNIIESPAPPQQPYHNIKMF